MACVVTEHMCCFWWPYATVSRNMISNKETTCLKYKVVNTWNVFTWRWWDCSTNIKNESQTISILYLSWLNGPDSDCIRMKQSQSFCNQHSTDFEVVVIYFYVKMVSNLFSPHVLNLYLFCKLFKMYVKVIYYRNQRC